MSGQFQDIWSKKFVPGPSQKFFGYLIKWKWIFFKIIDIEYSFSCWQIVSFSWNNRKSGFRALSGNYLYDKTLSLPCKLSQRPVPGVRKSGIPADVDTPAPVITIMFLKIPFFSPWQTFSTLKSAIVEIFSNSSSPSFAFCSNFSAIFSSSSMKNFNRFDSETSIRVYYRGKNHTG